LSLISGVLPIASSTFWRMVMPHDLHYDFHVNAMTQRRPKIDVILQQLKASRS